MSENIAHFKILDFKVNIGLNEYYDLGYVDSIEEGYIKIENNLNIELARSKKISEDTYGTCIIIEKTIKTAQYLLPKQINAKSIDTILELMKNNYDTIVSKQAHIFYLNQNTIKNDYSQNFNNIFDIKTRAHEETHALHQLGKIKYLEEALLHKQKVKIDFDSIKDYQVIADMGSIYVLKEKYNSLKENELTDKRIIETLTRKKFNQGFSFEEALEIYNNSIIK